MSAREVLNRLMAKQGGTLKARALWMPISRLNFAPARCCRLFLAPAFYSISDRKRFAVRAIARAFDSSKSDGEG